MTLKKVNDISGLKWTINVTAQHLFTTFCKNNQSQHQQIDKSEYCLKKLKCKTLFSTLTTSVVKLKIVTIDCFSLSHATSNGKALAHKDIEKTVGHSPTVF